MKRNGHSFMEMVVVISILTGLAALSYPMLKSPLSKMHLKAAAQEITTELSKTRMKAMQSGVSQVFQVQVNTGKFQSSPMAEPEPIEDTEIPSPLNDFTDNIVQEKELPSGVCFEVKEEIEELEDGWTNIAIFYPNGANNNALISLSHKSDLHVEVKLNGLTGSAKVGEVYRKESDE